MNGCSVPVLGRVSLLHDDDYTNENETGVGDRGLHGYPVGYSFPGEGELAVATLLQLLAGNEGGNPHWGSSWWRGPSSGPELRWLLSNPGTNQGPGSAVSVGKS